MMKKECLLWIEKMRQFGEGMQAEFVNDEQQRLLEIADMRLVVKFGKKKRYSDQECQAIYQELVEAGLDDEATPDAIEAVSQEAQRRRRG
jgi:hypothetical protein